MTKQVTFDHPPMGHIALVQYDAVNDEWHAVYVDGAGNLQVDVVDSGGADLGEVVNKLEQAIAALEKIDDLQDALNSVGVDELDVVLDGQNADVEVTQTTPADLVVAQHQYDGSAWRKSNLLWGYNDVVSEQVDDSNLPAGNQNLTGATVPAGEVWVITSLSIYFSSATISQILIAQVVDGNTVPLYANGSPSTTTWYAATGSFVLGPGDNLYGRFYGCTAGDTGQFRYAGYKMDIAM